MVIDDARISPNFSTPMQELTVSPAMSLPLKCYPEGQSISEILFSATKYHKARKCRNASDYFIFTAHAALSIKAAFLRIRDISFTGSRFRFQPRRRFSAPDNIRASPIDERPLCILYQHRIGREEQAMER